MHTLNWRAAAIGAALAALSLAAVPPGRATAAAADYHVGSLQITQPWARATPQGADSGAAYMTVTNTGSRAERLSCLSSNASGKCQIHQMTMQGGVMKMRPVIGGLAIKPGQTVTFKPGGYHVMLIGLKAPLQQGKTVEATLKVDNGGTVQVEFPIAAIGAPAPGATAGGGMQMQGPGMMPMTQH